MKKIICVLLCMMFIVTEVGCQKVDELKDAATNLLACTNIEMTEKINYNDSIDSKMIYQLDGDIIGEIYVANDMEDVSYDYFKDGKWYFLFYDEDIEGLTCGFETEAKENRGIYELFDDNSEENLIEAVLKNADQFTRKGNIYTCKQITSKVNVENLRDILTDEEVAIIEGKDVIWEDVEVEVQDKKITRISCTEKGILYLFALLPGYESLSGEGMVYHRDLTFSKYGEIHLEIGEFESYEDYINRNHLYDITGNWDINTDETRGFLPEEIQAYVDVVLQNEKEVTYYPVCYFGSQVVAGSNHLVLFKGQYYDDFFEEDDYFYAVMRITRSLDGSLAITKTTGFDFGAMENSEGEGTPGGLMGGWLLYEYFTCLNLPLDAQNAYDGVIDELKGEVLPLYLLATREENDIISYAILVAHIYEDGSYSDEVLYISQLANGNYVLVNNAKINVAEFNH